MSRNGYEGSAAVARRLETSQDTVRRLVAAGLLPAVQYGPRGRLRFRPQDVDAFLERAQRKAVAA